MDSFDRPRPSRRRVRTDEERERDAKLRDHLEAVDWGDVSARLVASARRMLSARKGNLADAQDLAQEAMRRVFDPDYKEWDPDEKTIEEHLASVVWGLVCNRGRNAAASSTDALDNVYEKKLPAHPGSLERDVERREIHDLIFAALRTRFAQKPLESRVVELFAEGIDLPREQVREIGQPYLTVYRARTRVMEEARRVVEELEKDHEED